MPTFQSAEVIAAEASPGEKYQNIEHVKSAEFNWTTTTETTSDVIELVELPQGSEVVGYSIVDAGSGFTDIDLGTTSGGAEIATGLNISGTTVSGMVAPVAVSTTGKVYVGPDAGTVSAAKLVNGLIFYID